MMQQKQKSHSPKRIKQLFGTLYSKTRQASKRAYEWSFANALLMTEILAFFIWGLRFQSTNKLAQAKKQKLPSQKPSFVKREFILEEHCFHNGQKLKVLPVSCRTLGKMRPNAVVLLDTNEEQSSSFWLREESERELFGKGQPFDAEKFFHVLLDHQSAHLSRAELIDLHYRILHEKLGISCIQVITATAHDTVNARLWREKYPEFVTCMHILR